MKWAEEKERMQKEQEESRQQLARMGVSPGGGKRGAEGQAEGAKGGNWGEDLSSTKQELLKVLDQYILILYKRIHPVPSKIIINGYLLANNSMVSVLDGHQYSF